MSNQIKNDYVPPSNASAFFIPHPEANHLNAQDVAFELISGAKNISVATFQCFKNGNELMIDAKIIANLIGLILFNRIQTIQGLKVGAEVDRKAVTL